MSTHVVARRRPALVVAGLLALLCVTLLAQNVIAQGAQSATVLRNANLRAGPGVTYAVTGGVTAGATVQVVDQTPASDWYELNTGQWIAAFLVRVHAPVASPARGIPAGAVAAQVVSITDGDTIRVRRDGAVLPVRYILINTPERDEPFGVQATAANRRLVEGKRVYLLQDVSETDRYGRLLRYVFLADGTHVNAELVRQGFAQVATFPPDVTREAEMRAAQQEAMAAGRGLWATGEHANVVAGAATTTAANLRSGPGTDFAVLRTLPTGTELTLTGRTAAGDWLQTVEGLWVYAALVTGAPTNLPIIAGGAPGAPPRSGDGVSAPTPAPVPAPSGEGGARWLPYTCPGNPSPPPDPACPIKGNISDNGRIFHAPGQRYYCDTIIDVSRGERWFCTPEEAVAAGWRAARR